MKFSILIFTTFIFCFVHGQNKKAIRLKWKLQPNEVLIYKTIMKQIDTSNHSDFSFDFKNFSKLASDSSGAATEGMKKMLQKLNNSLDDRDLITKLSSSKKGIVDIEMSMQKKDGFQSNSTDTSDKENKMAVDFLKTMMTGSPVLRGAVNVDGGIQSFYVKNDQKNLIAICFELPDKPIKIGESWPLDINLISMDQNFKCDSSFRQNKVSLAEIKKQGNETIAVLKYDIVEFVSGDFGNAMMGFGSEKKTTMKASYSGICEFSMERGRWITYEGIMTIFSEGFMNSTTTKKFSLIPQ